MPNIVQVTQKKLVFEKSIIFMDNKHNAILNNFGNISKNSKLNLLKSEFVSAECTY